MIRTIGLFLLLLLKILGWTLLILLLFLIAALLLVLFVPVRYDVRMQNERSMEPGQNNPIANLQLQLKITWMLRLLRFSISYGPGGMHKEIRAAGIDIPGILKKFAERKKRKRGRRNTKKKNAETETGESGQLLEKSSEVDTGAEAQISALEEKVKTDADVRDSALDKRTETDADIQDSALKERAETDVNVRDSVLEEKTVMDTKVQGTVLVNESKDGMEAHEKSAHQNIVKAAEASETSAGDESRQQGAEEAFEKKKRRRKTKKDSKNKKQKKPSGQAVKSKKEAAAQSQESGFFTKIRTQFDRLHKEYKDETNRHAVSCLWKELLKLLQNYKPRKLKVSLSFCLADPALTGAATGIVSLMPFIYRYPCSVVPDFISEKLYVEGEVQACGKVHVYVLALSLLRLLRDKEFMRVVRRLLKK